jgi:hypothetical protein
MYKGARVTTVAVKKKAISIAYPKFVFVALVIQQAMALRITKLSCVACQALH